jgi:hypothetical protein
MALNTDFTSGQILTAAQQNNFPRGLVSVTSTTTSSGSISSETLRVTSPSFTAVANRLYRISYYEPVLQYVSGTVNVMLMRIRLTNISGATQTFGESKIQSSGANTGYVSITKTLTPGATVFVASVAPTGGGNGNAYSASDAVCQLIIEDLGVA